MAGATDWVLVPRVATDAMLDAGVRGRAGGGLYGAYIEMIAAAPTPPAEARECPHRTRCDCLAACKYGMAGDGAAPAEAQGVAGIDQRARELLAEQCQSSQGAKQVLSGPWTLEQDRAIRAIAAALSAQPRPIPAVDEKMVRRGCEALAKRWRSGVPVGPAATEDVRAVLAAALLAPQPASAPVEAEPGAVRSLVAAANAVLALYPGDDLLWSLESAVHPFNATKPAECAVGCPPQQVCDYCQIASLAQQPAACETCGGRGEVGGLTLGGYESHPCPECEEQQPAAVDAAMERLRACPKLWYSDLVGDQISQLRMRAIVAAALAQPQGEG